VDRLLRDPRVDPGAGDNRAIYVASEGGYLGTVYRLLADSRVDPSAGHNVALREASRNGHVVVVDRLLQDARVDAAAGTTAPSTLPAKVAICLLWTACCRTPG